MRESKYQGQAENKKNKRIGRKVGNLVAGMLGAGIILVLLICVYMFQSLILRVMQTKCVVGTNMLAYVLENYTGPEDMTPVLDSLKVQLDCELAVYKGTQEVNTTVMQNGNRVMGMQLPDKVVSTVLNQGKSYIGKAKILGSDYICSYVPTMDANGKIDGLLFAGASLARSSMQTNIVIVIACVLSVVLIAVCISLLSKFIKKSVTAPLSKLTELAKTMEQGELERAGEMDLSLAVASDDEIGILARCFETMIDRLKGYIGEISDILTAISEGNLTLYAKQEYVGDFASIRRSLDGILERLNSTMAQIMQSTGQVANGSEQMANGAQALSQGAVQQAASVQQLEATMKEISDQVDQTADSAQMANRKASDVGGQILESNDKMQKMIGAMQEINASSSEIGKIIKTIEDIAFQTNILALNAAVEAARAGAAGKGFAVVADEVRNLASKSSEASQSTTALIENSITAVQRGTEIANDTAARLEEVVAGANEIVETIGKIADASRLQADSVSQVQEQLGQISSVVQTNSATAEESAATSEELSAQAGLLEKLVKTFHLSQKR